MSASLATIKTSHKPITLESLLQGLLGKEESSQGNKNKHSLGMLAVEEDSRPQWEFYGMEFLLECIHEEGKIMNKWPKSLKEEEKDKPLQSYRNI